LLGEDHVAFDSNIEDSVITFLEVGPEPEPFFQSGCQPGSPGVIVSRYAVGDCDSHRAIPPSEIHL
jgi:hypothetical protein